MFCFACEGRHKGVCGALEARQLVHLGRHSIRREVARGTELLAAGEPANLFANILSGVVKLYKLMSDGRKQLVGLQFAPDFIGRPFAESGAVTAEAANTVRICSFSRSVLETMISQSPGLERRLYEQALRELDEARDWMMTLGRKSAGKRSLLSCCWSASTLIRVRPAMPCSSRYRWSGPTSRISLG